MAANRTTQAALTIALSLFVMLTFALGVTTYLFFTKQEESTTAQATAQTEATQARTELAAIKDDMEKLRGIIGVPADTPVADIETELTKLFEDDLDGPKGDDKTYRKLIDGLRAVVQDESGRALTLEKEKEKLRADADAAVAAARQAQEAAEQAATEAKQALDAATRQFAEDRGKHDTKQGELLDNQRSAEDKARELESLKSLIVSVGDYLPPARQQALAEKKPDEQLDIIRNELRSQTKEIARLNEALTVTRFADPAVQTAIADLQAEDDRIAGFDGRIVDVDARTETALISCRSTAGLRPGLVLHVFPPGDERPQFGDRKAMLEVTQIEGPSLVRAVIRRESTRDPILTGDGVASSLWGPGGAPAIVIVGFSDVDKDGRSDRDRLTGIVSKAGGRIVDAVSPETALVVDLGQPSERASGGEVPGWAAESKRRDRAIKTAKVYGTRVGSLDTLLDMLGLDADAFDVGRLPRGRGDGRFPPRR